jgi:acyl-CoA thioesterase-1
MTQDLPPQDDPKLPRVLLLGDSISFGYTPEVRRLLTGQANVHRIAGTVAGTVRGSLVLDTRTALLQLDDWIGKARWDVIHFNWGLHDVKITPSGEHQVPIIEYEKNLNVLVRRLEKTGARLIWASTTPIPRGRLSPHRVAGDEEVYNLTARKIMVREKIPINDLHSLGCLLQKSRLQESEKVHFTEDGSARLGEQVTTAVRPLLKKQPHLKGV